MGSHHDKSDWSCQLRGRQGECRRGLEEDLLTCTCFGDVETGLDLFEDVADGNDDDDEGSLPYFLKQIIFLRLSQSYLFRSRERLLTPEQFGLENAENFYISSGNGTVGAWYLWPDDQPYTPITSLDGNSTIIVYMHGNSLDRGLSYRVALYKVLTSLGLHVITFDYRAYGDSSMVQLTEETVVSDGKAVLSWVTRLVSGPAIIVWGHSLGTAVATRVVAQMGSGVQGLLLESPFNKMEDEVNNFSVARWTAWAMGMDIGDVLASSGVQFLTEDYLPKIQAPALVLHSDDDRIVPAYLGERLVNTTRERGKENIELVRFGAELGLRHRYIYRAPGIEEIVLAFVNKTRQFEEN